MPCTAKPCPRISSKPYYQIKTLLLTKFGDMGLAVHDTSTKSHFTVHAVYCTRCVRVVYALCTRCKNYTNTHAATSVMVFHTLDTSASSFMLASTAMWRTGPTIACSQPRLAGVVSSFFIVT